MLALYFKLPKPRTLYSRSWNNFGSNFAYLEIGVYTRGHKLQEHCVIIGIESF